MSKSILQSRSMGTVWSRIEADEDMIRRLDLTLGVVRHSVDTNGEHRYYVLIEWRPVSEEAQHDNA